MKDVHAVKQYRCLGIIGVGRMGSILAARLSEHYQVLVYDHNPQHIPNYVRELEVQICDGMDELLRADMVILAIPDREVINCIKELRHGATPVVIMNIATNVAQSVLDDIGGPSAHCINVKIIGQADEMLLGGRPVIIVNNRPPELVSCAREVFNHVGKVLTGRADHVMNINNMAVEMALQTAVQLELRLRDDGINNPDIIESAISQVAAGVLKAYAHGDLGPFAREIVAKMKAQTGKKG